MLVVAAVIHHRGRVLICQRRKNDSFALKWEFPGGKVQPGETPEGALARELLEELGAESEIGEELYRTRHRYQEHAAELELIFFSARLKAAARNQAFERIVWTEPSALSAYDFLEADREFVARLSRTAVL